MISVNRLFGMQLKPLLQKSITHMKILEEASPKAYVHTKNTYYVWSKSQFGYVP